LATKPKFSWLNPENVTREIIQEMFNEENRYLKQIYNALGGFGEVLQGVKNIATTVKEKVTNMFGIILITI